MNPKKIRTGDRHSGPEAKIQAAFVKMMDERGWFVQETHGNLYQFGLPDTFCAHRMYGSRWVEIKNPLSFHFTRAQKDKFPKMAAAGVGIWIVFEASEHYYQLILKGQPNWLAYINKTSLLPRDSDPSKW